MEVCGEGVSFSFSGVCEDGGFGFGFGFSEGGEGDCLVFVVGGHAVGGVVGSVAEGGHEQVLEGARGCAGRGSCG